MDGREHASVHLGLPNYVNNLKQLCILDEDLLEGGGARLPGMDTPSQALLFWITCDLALGIGVSG